ncbi:MAG: AAA family ATPase [Methanothrix sp.]|nr:AAA family ATPase [Methanothrix sp.]
MAEHPIEWWTSKLSRLKRVSDGWMAECPAHKDLKQSLHLTVDDSGGVVVYCFAGCEYEEILSAIEKRDLEVEPPPSIVRVSQLPSLKGSEWWSTYTGIPWSEWSEWGVKEEANAILFTWQDSRTVKRRAVGKKEFIWSPQGYPTPPLWPTIPPSLPKRIWLCEGESDSGILRHLGYPAYGITKGAGVRGIHEILVHLKDRGVCEVVLPFDADQAGEKGSQWFSISCREAGLLPIPIDLQRTLNPLQGEKDLRDLWLRLQDITKMKKLLDFLVESAASKERSRTSARVSLDEFLRMPIDPALWLVDRVWLNQTIGLLVGFPKMGKSWLSLDLAVSIASNTPFLGKFAVKNPGPVVLITKEDPDHLLQDRLQKILLSKGLGGEVIVNEGSKQMQISLPKNTQTIPLYIDLTREFLFKPEGVTNLLIWLREIRDRHGYISLVVFDPILRMLEGIDEFKASEVNTAVFSAASRIQREIGSAVCLVHHKGKGGAEGKGSYGSIAFHAFSENTLYLQGEEPDADGWVNVRGEFKSSGESSWSYRFPELEKAYQVEVQLDTAPSLGTPQGIGKMVLQKLQDIFPDGLTIPEILQIQDGITDYMLRAALHQLEAQGLLRSEKDLQAPSKGGPKKNRWYWVPQTEKARA